MKNKILSLVTKSVVAVALAVLVSACSDGEHAQGPQLSTSLPVPTITKFQISKIGGSDSPGKSVTIKEGDSVLLEWEVTLGGPGESEGGLTPKVAKAEDGGESGDDGGSEEGVKVALDSEALGIHEKDLDTVGSKKVDGVKSDAVFVLTATHGEERDALQVSAVVEDALPPMEVSFTASPAEIHKGDSTELCWDVSRSDAKVTIIDSDGNTIVSDSVLVGEVNEPVPEMDLVEGGAEGPAEVVEPESYTEQPVEMASTDCIIRKPTKSVTYYLTVIVAGEEPVDKEAAVTVAEKLKIEYFTATPDTVVREQEVTLEWKVVPAETQVAISADQGAMTLDISSAEGSSIVTVSETTTFSLSATYEDQNEVMDLVVKFELKAIALTPIINGVPMLEATGTIEAGTYFEGEQVGIGWEAALEGGSVDDIQVTVSGMDSQYGPSENVDVTVSGSGEYTVTASAEGVDPTSTTVKVNVRKWVGTAIKEDGSTVAEVYPLPGSTDTALVGFRGDLTDGGILQVGKIIVNSGSATTSLFDIEFQRLFQSAGDLAGKWNPKFIKNLDTFPANAIISDDNGRTFVGSSGGIVYTNDHGETWKELVLTGYKYNDGSYPGSHRSCNGMTQDGRKANDKFPVTLEQVCDIVIDEDGRFIAATDHMVAYLPNGVDKYLNEGTDYHNWWIGMPAPGEQGNEVYATVNHDIELAVVDGHKKLFSATDKGLFVTPFGSGQLDFSWQKVEGIDAPLFSVTADTVNEQLYAGAEDGLYVGDLAGTSWTKINAVSGPVYDVKVDPAQVGSIYVATGAGIMLSRNDGTSWVDITKGNMEGVGVVEALSVSRVGNKVGIFAATDKGAFASVAAVEVTDTVLPEEGEEGEVEEEVSPEDETVVGEEAPPEEGEQPTEGESEVTGPTVGGEETVTATEAMGDMM